MMASRAAFARQLLEFEELKASLSDVVDLTARLPAWPFMRRGAFSYIVEFDRVVSAGFSAVLAALADSYGDHGVTTVVLDPDVDYYRDAYSLYPGFEVATEHLARGFGEGLFHEPEGDPTGVLAYTANVIAVGGASKQWALWAQRDWEIAVMCTSSHSSSWLSTEVPVFGRNVPLDSIRSPSGWGLALASDDLLRFQENLRLWGSGA